MSVGEKLTLPLDVVSRRTAVLGQTDTGKTSTAVVIVEEAAACGAQFVVIDPTGAWYGLRSSADGEGPGVDCVVMGGDHGDVPLDDHAGKVVAGLIAEEGYSLVLDLDGMPSWAARQRFVADLTIELYERAHSQILVVIDEAHRFAPQSARDVEGAAARSLGGVSDVVLLGRRRGLATIVVSQRPARLHKDVLEMSEVLIAHRLRGNNDRKALQGWIEEADLDVRTLLAEVGGLAKGVAHVSAPTLGINGTYTIRPKHTFDSSRSIGVGEVAVEPRARADVDMGALRERMAATIERAEADDPAKLRARIAALERQLAEAPDVGDVEEHGRMESDLLEIRDALSTGRDDDLAINADALLARIGEERQRRVDLERQVAEFDDAPIFAAGYRYAVLDVAHAGGDRADGIDALEAMAEALDQSKTGGHATDALNLWREREAPPAPVPPPAPRRAEPIRHDPSLTVDDVLDGRTSAPPSPNGDRGQLIAGARRMLVALARYGPLTRAELSTLANSFGGAMRNNLTALREAEPDAEAGTPGHPAYVAEEDGRVELTPAGARLLGTLMDDIPFGVPLEPEEVAGMYESKLVAGARRILGVVMRAPDRGFTRKELEGLAGSRGGAFRNNLSALRRKGLIEERARRVYPGHVLYFGRIVERRG